MKQEARKITWLTAYDFPTVQFAEAAELHMILVGDSLGMCVYGYPGTVAVTMDQRIVHCDAVRRGAPNTFGIGLFPDVRTAVERCVRFEESITPDLENHEKYGGYFAIYRMIRDALAPVEKMIHETFVTGK